MTPEQLREWADAIEGEKPWAPKAADVCDQLRAHAAALEEIERLKVKLAADELAWHEQEEAIRDLRAERDARKRHAEEVKRDLAASVVKSAELEEENSKLRSALAIVHFKREPWQ